MHRSGFNQIVTLPYSPPGEYWLSHRSMCLMGAHWLSGRALDSRPKGGGLESHQRHCIVSLSKTHWSLLNTNSTQQTHPSIIEKVVDRCVKNQINVPDSNYCRLLYHRIKFEYGLCTQKNLLIETVLLNTNNICFGWGLWNIVFNYVLFTLWGLRLSH